MRSRVITLPGIVEKVFTSRLPGELEIAQIGVEWPDHSKIRIENTLISENGKDVHLKGVPKVKVTTLEQSGQKGTT